jgi:hypothetical protein
MNTNDTVPGLNITRAELHEWVAASCQAQGVPILVTDPTILATVATLIDPASAARRSLRNDNPRHPKQNPSPPTPVHRAART